MRNIHHLLRITLALSAFAWTGNAAAQQAGGAAALTIEQLIDIKHPSEPLWSPDGRHVVFVWDRAGISNFYLADAAAQGQPIALTSFSDGRVQGAFWSHDGQAIYFPHNGALWQVAIAGGSPRPAWTVATTEFDFAPSPDGKRVAFVRPSGSPGNRKLGSDLVLRNFADGAESTIAHNDVSIESPMWSPDGANLAYIGGTHIIRHDESPDYSGAKIIYAVSEEVPGQLYVVPMSGGKPAAIGTAGEYAGAAWLDSAQLVFGRQSPDYKIRTIYTASISDGVVRSVHEDKEEKFWSIPDWGDSGADPLPSPDGRWIAFLTDQDGWDHLYVMPSAGGQPTQITKGHFEAWRPRWSHDSTCIAFDANESERPGDRHVGIATIGSDPTHATIAYITTGNGTNIKPQWSADDKRVLFQHTDTHNSADLFAIDAKAGAKPVRLSDSMPPGMDRSAFVEPQFVRYPGANGELVPGWLFLPKNLDRSKKHPVIVWIHGDGVNQNYDGWHVQRNYAVYYSFHQYLLQKGYIVFAPDYRGSIGYGRTWRVGVHMNVGTQDAKDAWMAANYLKTLSYVDSERIGIWGLSYGGFFTVIAMTEQPLLYRAGVDVAGPVDYFMYYADPYHNGWTASRIGTPEQNPQVYTAGSPVLHVDRLERPLLVLHGTSDINVPFLQSIRLMDEVLKKNKSDLVSFMVYPGEFHYFTRAHVLRDAWHRVADFFDANLLGASGP